jgi:alpha-mannosidase
MHKNDEKNQLEQQNKDRIQCHFISNTHWDREWRYSAQRTRHMLCYMMDMLLDILEKEPRFQSFHLDSQTVPILDYLEIYPEKEEILRKHIKEGRIVVGPWFCLPDEFLVGGESLIRNLLLGHKIAAKFGPVSKTGYSPFSWGQISQMPQIYKGFGIDMISFYRGINTLVAPKSEFVWEGPDGTRIYASRLSVRPRYNVWYIIQRPVYWDEQNEGNRYMKWKRDFGPFHFIDIANKDMDYQYTHSAYRARLRRCPVRL